jgi:hypothetical protein
VSENKTRQSNYEHQKIKGDTPHVKVRPSATRGIQRKVSNKKEGKRKKKIERN